MAVEAKEGVVPKEQGKVLGLFTLQNLVALYPSSPWCNPALLRGGIYIRDSDDSEAV